MIKLKVNARGLRRLAIGATMMGAVMLGSGATAQKRKDQAACAKMGASRGSPAYTGCMMQQQRRRDRQNSTLMEQQLMAQELGRPAREKLAEKRARRAREKDRAGYEE
ncbi:hypothetical protein IFT54_12305 [Sphingomonas sp. CFBP 13714]|uniref:hypothetical protein n=1 Tax=Sphingomonas sp. CFBP 13714 TaxID=2775308 RepID=UPI00177ACDAB|nr:hypothetical protein [Sphingomonas sp. CFBP 13714]MBD8700603.1 hypothetical protein [Sphingomonas sp. CFBP 13714]